MKLITKTLTALILTTPLCMSAFAEEQKAAQPQQHEMQGMQHGQGMGMMGGMSEEQMDQHMRMKQDQMLQMHELSNKILSATDPKEKEKLKEQQLKLMKEHHQQMMSMMHGGMGAGPKGPGQHEQHQKQDTEKTK